MPKIFISYRRKPNTTDARLLNERLSAKYGQDNVFHDVSSLTGGTKFPSHIPKEIEECDIFILLVDEGTLSDKERIFSENDWVRKEIRIAIKNGKRIIPVLIDKYPMPESADLPEDIRDLLNYHATVLWKDSSSNQFDASIKDITDVIDGFVDEQQASNHSNDTSYDGLFDFFKPIKEGIALQKQHLIARAGHKNANGTWSVHIASADGHGIHGPYITLFEGKYNAVFRMQINNNNSANGYIVSIDATHKIGRIPLADTIPIRAEDFNKNNEFQDFTISFQTATKIEDVEFRLLAKPKNHIDRIITLHSVRLEKLS